MFRNWMILVIIPPVASQQQGVSKVGPLTNGATHCEWGGGTESKRRERTFVAARAAKDLAIWTNPRFVLGRRPLEETQSRSARIKMAAWGVHSMAVHRKLSLTNTHTHSHNIIPGGPPYTPGRVSLTRASDATQNIPPNLCTHRHTHPNTHTLIQIITLSRK